MRKEYMNCIIKGIKVPATPEERVRQDFLKRLINEFEYPIEHIDVEVPIYYGSGNSEVEDVETGHPKRADIVIYRNAQDKALREKHYIIIECKKKEEQSGERQVKTYGNVTRAPIIVWHNGLETRYWTIKKEPNEWSPKAYLPKFGEVYGDKKILKKDLRPATNLQATFKRIHNDIYANLRSANKAKVFYQVVYLLFAKIQDEKDDDESCKFVIYDREFEEISQRGISSSFSKRILSLFEKAKEQAEYRNVFDGTEKIEIPALQIAHIVSEIENITVLRTDVKGEAFQAFLSSHFRGDAGQFFTPDPIKHLMVEIIDPKPNEVTLDPACGSSGFLVFTINHYRQIIKKQKNWVNADGTPLDDSLLTDEQKELLKSKIKEIARDYIKGIDFDNDLTKVAKLYMVMIDDGHTGIHTSDSLVHFSEIEKDTNGDIRKESAEIILTNPPFGTKGKVKNIKILQNFDFGHKWDKKDDGSFTKGEVLKIKGKSGGQVPDILFIERCIEFLKPGGRMGIVLPDGDLNNQNTEYVRYWLENKVQVVSVVSIPSTAFDPYGAQGIKTSVLFLKKPMKNKRPPDNYPIFFANIEYIGYDVSGKPIYQTNENGEVLDIDGNIIPYKLNKKREQIKQDIELIRKRGAIKNDIPQILEDWKAFRQRYKSVLW